MIDVFHKLVGFDHLPVGERQPVRNCLVFVRLPEVNVESPGVVLVVRFVVDGFLGL